MRSSFGSQGERDFDNDKPLDNAGQLDDMHIYTASADIS